MTLLRDDGTPAYPDDSNLDISAQVMLSRPQRADSFPGYQLELSEDFIKWRVPGIYCHGPPDYDQPPPDRIPLGILIWCGELPVGILTAAPYPLADTGSPPCNLRFLSPSRSRWRH